MIYFKQSVLISLTLFTASFLQACSQYPSINTISYAQNNRNLTLTGSSTIKPLVVAIAKRYQAKYPNVRINVKTGGSSQGIKDASEGNVDIGMVSRSLKAKEKHLLPFTIAKDGISVLIHKNNPIKSLTNKQIVDIYTNKINNWRQVGGKNAPIFVVSKAENHSTGKLFAKFFQMPIKDISADKIIGDNPEAIAAVNENPNTIAYVSIGAAEYDIVHGAPLKLLPIEGVAATIANVKNGTFPLSRPLNLVTNSTPIGLKKDFIDFARSEKVYDLVREQSFVPTKSESTL
ncbi:phosphate ABC transporter substrate-binding protein [Mastigocoleus sp. MO_188.B34]|uniref:phosphate ABC transporter substrate-binding protein n=1 Tax=Mastigocoleus sp. MO_188.B34 TaxID=3036635 RepID=UPI002622E78D|nr:phosphate ABC transporter substrate-binding protein [Mastigocoleus sp. MO_188.B34]MDJ0695373.1 phosphate ABC transporter substrate-binding protein [Mastigocoleus sp. MO_188.B34]